MSNTTQLEKQFPCFDCKDQIKIKRKADDSGWIRYESDGVTLHDCKKKKLFPSKQQQDTTEVKSMLQQILSRLDSIEEQIAAK